jgi:uncharacterized glyoxalase superfamily protein PhnB
MCPCHLQTKEEAGVKIAAIPEGFHTITPNVIVDDAPKAIAFLSKAFGAKEVARLTMPDGKVVHGELQIGDSRLNLGESMEGWPAHALVAQLYVDTLAQIKITPHREREMRLQIACESASLR